MLGHAGLETGELAVDVNHLARAIDGGDEVNRPDAVVQRQPGEVVAGRTVTHAHIVNLHRRVEADAVAVDASQALHLIEVLLYLLPAHVDGALDRDGRMGRETQMSKALGNRLGHKFLHRGMAIAILRVGVQVIQVGLLGYSVEVKHDGS